MKVGLFIGRFAPLHKGHLRMIKECAKKVDLLIIGLGSSDAELSFKNPFTVKERSEMVRCGMKEIGVKSYEIVELQDFESDKDWVKEVVDRVYAVAPTPPNPRDLRSLSPSLTPSGRGGKIVSPPFGGGVRGGVTPFDLAWSGSEWVLRVFTEHGLPIKRIKEFPGLSGTKIRKRMVKGLPWLTFIPLSIRKYLKEIKAVQRVKNLCLPR